MPSKYVAIDGVAIHYTHAGATTLPDVPPPFDRGVPLVFLHGAGGCAALWSSYVAALGRDHSPVAIDFPAHGRSAGLDAVDSIAKATALVGELLRCLRVPPAVIVGHGYGGQVALELCLAHPDRVRGAVVIGTAAKPDLRAHGVDKLRQVVAGRLGQQFDTPFFGSAPDMAVARGFWMEMVKTDPRVRLADLAAYERSDLTDRLCLIHKPVLVIHGSQDQLCDEAHADELVAKIPSAMLATIEGGGHVVHLEKPDEVQRAIESFLAAMPA